MPVSANLFSNRSCTTTFALSTSLIALIGAAGVITTDASASLPVKPGAGAEIAEQPSPDVTALPDYVPTAVLNDILTGPGVGHLTYEGSWQTTGGASSEYLADDRDAAPPVTASATPSPSRSGAASRSRPGAAQPPRAVASPAASQESGGTAAAPESGEAAALHESGEGAEQRPYASRDVNDQHPLWHVEPGSSPVDRADGKIKKIDDDAFHRMFSIKRFGGPGTSLEISYRARATAIRDRAGSSIIAGAKIGMKFPVAESLTGYGKDDPRSVHGTSGQHDADSPGSYAFVTGLTQGGYMELARNGYGNDGYEFFGHESVGYTPGDWKDVVVKVDWLADRGIRVRYWHNADAAGAPVYEATDTDSPFWDEPGFLWLRSDDADWEYDSLTVHER